MQRKMEWSAGRVLALAATLVAGTAAAQQPLNAAARAEVADSAAAILERNYVSPDVGRRLADLLRDSARRDAWARSDPGAFAGALTGALNAIAHDLHLVITPPAISDGAAPQAGGGPRRMVRRMPTGAAEGAGEGAQPARGRRVVRRAVPAGAASGSVQPSRRPAPDPNRDLPSSYRLPDGVTLDDPMAAPIAARVADERMRNHYFHEAEVLRGNVGYLDLDQFPIMPDAAPAADAAMLFLADVDAFILDLRGNPGGGEGMNQYLSSFFFTDSVPLYARYYRPDDETREYWTRPELPPVHLPDVPLYVLVDGRSGSAAENMAFSLRNAGRATVVGETTAGAGHSSTRMDLPAGFSIVVPIARVYDPRTGREFEGAGIVPDVEVPSEEAAARAHLMAIEALMNATHDPLRAGELSQVAALIRAHSLPAFSPEQLAAYAGDYGNRRLWVEDGQLMLQRTDVPGAPELALLRTGEDAFVLQDMTQVRIEFTRGGDGTVHSVRVLNPMSQWEESVRRR